MRNKVKILFTLLFFLLPIFLFSQITVNATTPIYGDVGDIVLLPINVNDLTGQNITSIEFEIHYDQTKLNVTGYESANTLSNVLSTVALGNRSYGKFLGGYGSTALAGSGELIYVKVQLLVEGTFSLDILEFYLNSTKYTVNNVEFVVGLSEVSLPTSDIDKKETKLLPITIEDVSTENVTGFEFTFTYDPNIIEILDLDKSGTLCQNWTISSTITNGTCIVGGFNSAPLAAGTILINLKVYGKEVGSSSIEFESFKYNEGIPGAKLTNGVLTVISVNELPIITSAPANSNIIYKKSKYSFQFTATDPDEDNVNLVWSYIIDNGTAPDSISLSQENDGELVIIPSLADIDKSFSVQVTVTDDYGESADTTINYFISGENRLPHWTIEIPDVTITENQTISLDFGENCVDLDNDEIMFSFQLKMGNNLVENSGVIDRSSGIYIWTPTFLQSGYYELTVTATDGEDESTQVVMITVTNINHDPVITDAPAMSVILSAGIKYSYLFEATDFDEDNVNFSWTYEKLAGSTVDSISFCQENNGELIIIPGGNELEESFAYKFTVSDDFGASVDTSIIFIILTGNSAPIWTTNMEDKITNENKEITLNFAPFVFDNENDNITFTKELYDKNFNIVENSGIITETGIFTWTPDYTQAGIYSLIITAHDRYSSANDTILIAVSNVNQLPVITDVPADTIKLKPNEAFSYQLGAYDLDAENKILQWSYEIIDGIPADSMSLIIDKLYIMANNNDEGNIFKLKLFVMDDYNESTDTTVIFAVEDLTWLAEEGIPTSFTLEQNYPNPFNPTTSINYQISSSTIVKITIYDIMGNEIRTLVNEKQDAGYKSVTWDARDNAGMKISTGIYVYQLQAGEYSETKKMMFLK